MISANAMTTAMNTERNDIKGDQPPGIGFTAILQATHPLLAENPLEM
jgi:hypothetical protein